MTPPPIPQPFAHRIFYGRAKKSGPRLASPKEVSEKIQDAHQQVEEWLNANRSIEVISISNGFVDQSGAHATFITVWYRESGEK